MLFIWLGLVITLTLAGLVTLYVAYPHRGEAIPHAEWLSNVLTRSNAKVTEKLSALDDRLTARRDEKGNNAPR